MADLQISQLPSLAEANIAATDELAIVDTSASETKRVTAKALVEKGVSLIDAGSIPGTALASLGANTVVTASITDANVTTAKIANGAVTATQIADATITGAKLVNDTVTATQIAANAITASELADNAVDTAAIAANAVTTAKITDANVTYAKLSLSDGDIPGAKIASGGITATQIAANAVTASELADDAVDTAAIAANAVTAAKIAANTITANEIAANAVGASELADNAVDTAAIADGAVTSAKLSGALASSAIADNAVTTAKIADDAVTSAKLAANAVDAAALADNAVDSGAIASTAVTEAKLASSAVTNAKIADGTITAAKLATGNIDRSLNVASGNLGINNTITAATRSGITYNAQGLITSTAALAASDLPLATTSAVGGVSISSTGGLAVTNAGVLSIAATTTAGTATKVTFNGFGQVTASASLAAGDLPKATASAVGGVSVPTGGPLSVDGNGALTVSDSGATAGTGTKLTVNAKGIVTGVANIADSDLPNHSAALLTSGTINAARIGAASITGDKLSNTSTAIFQSIAQSGYPTAQFNGQILFDTVSEDAYIWDGNAWQAITTLTKGSLVFGGNFNANTSKMTACTSAGLAAGLAVGSNLPTPSSTTDGLYVVVDTAGTPSAPAPVVAFSPPDYILGVTNSSGSSWNEIDLSQTVAGQVASNITFTPYGQISSTNVQDALQEVETEKLALAGGTVTGELLIGHAGSLVFEGATADAFETTLTVADPTTSDKTITLPNVTGTVITTGDTGTVTSTMLLDGTILNADINASAAIAFSKLAALTSAQILVGNGSNVATSVAVTGDIAISNAGVTSIAAGAIVDADISGSAAITGSKIATGTTSAVGVLQLTDSASSTSATTAATPAAVKTAKDAADAAATTANAALPKAGGTMTGNLILDNAKELRLSEADSDGAHFTGFKAQAQSADITYTLPASAPTTGQVLKAGSTATTLEWAADSATDSSKMPLAGGTFTGDVTFTGDSSNGLWDKSASAFVADLTGTASIATSITVADESSDTTCNVLFATGATGNLAPKSGTNLTFNSSSGALTATSFVGALTGNVTGNVSGSAATVTGAAQSAITSLGTLTGLTVDGNLRLNDSDQLQLGSDSDSYMWHDGSNAYVRNTTGSFILEAKSGENAFVAIPDGAVELYHNNYNTLSTRNNGIEVTGPDTDAAIIGLNADNGDDNADKWQILAAADGVFAIRNYSTGSWVNGLTLDGSNNATFTGYAHLQDDKALYIGDANDLSLFHDATDCRIRYNHAVGSLKFQKNDNSNVLTLDGSGNATFAEDVNLADSKKINIGDDSDLQLYHDSNHSYILNTTGDLKIKDASAMKLLTNSLRLKNADDDETYITADNGGAVEIFHNNDRQLYTTATGIIVGDADHADVRLRIDHEDNTGSGGLKINAFGTASIELLSNFSGSADGGVPSGAFGLTTSHAKDIHICTNGASRMTIASGGAVTCSGTVSDSKGNLRSIPLNTQSSAYNAAASDAGKTISISSGGVTIPASTFAEGDALTIINNSGSDQTITCSAITMYLANDTTAKTSLTLAGRGMATMYFLSGGTAYASGAGLS